MVFKNSSQRKAVMSKLNPGKDHPRAPSGYYYPVKRVKPSISTRLNVKHDIHNIASQDGSLVNSPQVFDEYKTSVNDEMDKDFDHDYNKIVSKAEKQYRKEKQL